MDGEMIAVPREATTVAIVGGGVSGLTAVASTEIGARYWAEYMTGLG